MKDVAKQYEVEKYIRLQHSVESAIWNEEKGKWDLHIRSGSTLIRDECDVFINASGVLKYVFPFRSFAMWVLIKCHCSNWKWPSIEGLNSFKGRLMHSAHWDSSYDFTGKRVACIGIGSSGIQIVPKLASGTLIRLVHQVSQITDLSSGRKYGLLRTKPNVDQPGSWNQRAHSK